MSFVPVMQCASSHGRWILLCKLQNYNSALGELSGRPLTKVSASLSRSVRSLRLCFRRNEATLTATLRPDELEKKAAFSLPSSLLDRFSFRQFCKSPVFAVTLDSLRPQLSMSVSLLIAPIDPLSGPVNYFPPRVIESLFGPCQLHRRHLPTPPLERKGLSVFPRELSHASISVAV